MIAGGRNKKPPSRGPSPEPPHSTRDAGSHGAPYDDPATFRAAFDVVEEAIHAVDRNLTILQANRSLLQWNSALGFPTEVIGRPLKAVYPFLGQEVVDQYRRIFASGEELLTTETTTLGERTIVTRTRKVPVRANDRVERVITIMRNATDEQRFAEAVRFGTERLHALLDSAVQGLATLAEQRDPYTAGHQQRVTGLAAALAEGLGLGAGRAEAVRVAATLHDIGKIHIPAEILNKPGRLSDLEMMLIRTHPQVAYDILKVIPFGGPVAEIVLQHHEKLDGSGYPRGLRGEVILLESRILAVADVVEAMAHNRPYRPPHGIAPALEAVRQGAGREFDAAVVEACLGLFDRGAFSFDE